MYDNFKRCPIAQSEFTLFAGFELLPEFGLPDSVITEVAVVWCPPRFNDTGFLETIALVCVSGHLPT